MKLTGIPAHLAVAKEVKELREEVANLNKENNQLKTDVETKLPGSVADKVVSELRQHFVLGGVAPVSLRDLANLAAEFRNAISCIQPSCECEAVTPIETPPSDWRTWQWGDGQLSHAVPKGWEFPAHTSVKQMWNLWFFGNKDTGIRPYKLLSKQHDIQSNHQMRHSASER
ncbi:hypothetical protein GQ600_16283 [Phytophthora cactorum]|nr:hypothetical protein GQ600_16283 [Phytophthora cactorum]